MQTALDGKSLMFDQAGSLTATVTLEPMWDKQPTVGYNQGAAGIAFSAEGNRASAGGQHSRKLKIQPYRP